LKISKIFSNFRRRSSSNTRKKSALSTPNTTTSKSATKSPDKTPLLEQTTSTSTAAIKRKLIPERTVQISDVSSSKIKSSDSTGTKPEISASKPTLTVADSGIYGADITEATTTISKPISSSTPDPPKIHGIDLPDTSESLPTVVVNRLPENLTTSAIIVSDNIEINPAKESSFDNTIQSAYSNLIDATTSENEGTICGSSLHSRRTSTRKSSSSMIQELNNIETIVILEQTGPSSSSHNIIPFNPLHVILKDANKYYTTEYI
jgi:hypothetical protein